MSIARHLIGRRALLLAAGSAVPASYAQAEPAIIDISSTPAGRLPAGFSTARTGRGAAAAWMVLEDQPGGGRRVLAQTSTDRTDFRFPLAIYDRLSARNVDVSVRFKSISGDVDQAGGIAIRLTDPDNYYVVRANALEDNVNFYRIVRGSRRQIAGVSATVASGVWHRLGLRAERDRFTISFDGGTLFTAQDSTFANAGRVALWTKADSVTYFTDLTITPLA